ncbi:molybdopterin-binding domain of aldehyde dehydrogenase, partial [Helicosporidium sp. ATCC 50920]
FFAADVPGSNAIGPIVRDEELFASEEVHCVGQIVGVAVAETEAQARAAARAVAIEYEDLPAILSIAEARAADSFFHAWSSALDGGGDVEEALRGAEVVLEGELECGGQEHFYLEPNVSWVVPGEGGEVLSHSSTQCLEKHQKYIAEVLGLPMHRVTVRTKRLGGGFGGKETRAANLNAAAAVPAFLLQRPVRLCLDRDEDMLVTGQRHAFAMRYRLGCSRSGDFLALDAELFCNAGFSLDLSASVMERALMHADGVYRLAAVRLRGRVCRTNQASHTAFRGFGAPQAQLFAEMLVERVAAETGLSALALRERNMYRPGDCQFFGQVLDGCQARRCWDLALASADHAALRRQADAFNAAHRFRKRGLAAIPTKFGISFTAKFLNQAGALVHVYTDGSCLLTHGGVEMGQGLHTKVAQVVAQRLGLPLDRVHVSDTATDKVPNASPTAASASSDMYGAAAVDACDQILARLGPYLDRERAKLGLEREGRREEGDEREEEGGSSARSSQLPAANWKAAVVAAYLDRVDLSAHGFYATPDLGGFGSARPFNYLCYGAAVCLVELDALTGDWRALRADVVMDVGQSLNPAIDVGQVEGAFVQGLGWACLEEVVWGDVAHPWVPRGQLYTRGPGTYKIPSVSDIPLDFRVSLLADAPCRQTPAVHSSKAVGEPPFFLGTSALFALRDAVAAARRDAGVAGWFELNLPATPEKLRMACLDPCSAPFAGPGFQALASV